MNKLRQHMPGLSGVRILDGGVDAFTERIALIDAAQRSIDAQYYIWNSDLTGQYMAHAIYAAAERGVRVRLLLDDINVAGRDATIAALDAHRNVEIRIYNPFPQRDGARKMLDLVTDFSRLNRRMHNKSFTVDGAVTIVGGRNIGDEYFDVNPGLVFRDRDVEVIGPIVDQVGTMFDAFWNSELTYPIAALSSKRLSDAETAEAARRRAQDRRNVARDEDRPARGRSRVRFALFEAFEGAHGVGAGAARLRLATARRRRCRDVERPG